MAFWNRDHRTTTETPAVSPSIPAGAQEQSIQAGPFASFGALRRFELELAAAAHVHAVRMVRMERGYARFQVLTSGPVRLPETTTLAEQAGLPARRGAAVAAAAA